jgi:hypothetical protein
MPKKEVSLEAQTFNGSSDLLNVVIFIMCRCSSRCRHTQTRPLHDLEHCYTSFLCALESIMTKGKFGTVLSTSYSCLHISMEHSSCCLDATERKWYLLAEICRLNSRTKYQKKTQFCNTLIKAYLGMFYGGKVGITCKRTVQVSRRTSSALLVHVSSSLSAGSLALMISLVRDASRLKVPTDLHLQTHPTTK